MGVLVQNGLARLVKVITESGGYGLNYSTLHLFKNDFTPDVDSMGGDFTEADYAGYAVVYLHPWSAPAFTAPATWKSTANQGIFAVAMGNPAQDVYGWYILNPNGEIMGAARFPGAPLNLGGTVVAIGITPSFSEEPA